MAAYSPRGRRAPSPRLDVTAPRPPAQERIFIDAIQSYYFSGRAAGVRRARTRFFWRSVELRPRP